MLLPVSLQTVYDTGYRSCYCLPINVFLKAWKLLENNVVISYLFVVTFTQTPTIELLYLTEKVSVFLHNLLKINYSRILKVINEILYSGIPLWLLENISNKLYIVIYCLNTTNEYRM
jgi:hypothetical protein